MVDELKFTLDNASSISNIGSDNCVTISPNPFDSYTTIRWESQISGHTSLVVFDEYGRKVKTLLDEFRQQGENTVYLDSKELYSGIYYYQLKVGDNITTGKIIIIK
jgi:hypothetical protein